jgi:hypothetical protein
MIRPALFCIAAATLMLELLLTRVFDVILTPNLAYMVIACALFSFGLAGVYVTLRPARDTAHLPLLCALFGVASLALLPVLNALPFDYERFGDQPIVQLVSFAVMYLALVVPFFLSGLVFTLLFSANARAIQSLYCWDLAGAAAGCAVMVPLLGPIGPGGILFAVGACGLLAGGLLARDRRWLIAAAVTAAALVAIPAARSPRYFEFVEHLAKRGVKEARLEGRIEFSRWDPIPRSTSSSSGNWTGDGATQAVHRAQAHRLRRRHAEQPRLPVRRRLRPAAARDRTGQRAARRALLAPWRAGLALRQARQRPEGAGHRQRRRPGDEGRADVRRVVGGRRRDGPHRRRTGSRPLRRLWRADFPRPARAFRCHGGAQLPAASSVALRHHPDHSNHTSSSVPPEPARCRPTTSRPPTPTATTSRT